MDNESLKTFQKQLDEVLADTEEFVKASKQLNLVRESLNNYAQYLNTLNIKTKELVDNSAKMTHYAEGFFNGDFTKEATHLNNECLAIIQICEEKANLLKTQYDNLLADDNFKDLHQDHIDLLNELEVIESSIAEIKNQEEQNSEAIKEILNKIS